MSKDKTIEAPVEHPVDTSLNEIVKPTNGALDQKWQGKPDDAQPAPEAPKDDAQPAPKDDEPVENEHHLNKLISERDQWKNKYRQLQEEAKELQEIKAQREADAKQAELTALESEGKYREALVKVQEEWETKHTKYVQKVQDALVPGSIKAAAAKIPNIDPDAIDDLPILLGGRVQLDTDSLEPVVVDDTGKPLLDENLNQISVEQLVTQFVQARPRMLLDSTARGSGARPGSGGSGKIPTSLQELVQEGTSGLKDMSMEDVKDTLGAANLSEMAKQSTQARVNKSIHPGDITVRQRK